MQRCLLLFQLVNALLPVTPRSVFPRERSPRGADLLDVALGVRDRRWRGALAQRAAGTSGIQKADRFVRQLAPWHITPGQADGLDNGFIHNAYAVVSLEHASDGAHHIDGFLFTRLFHFYHLKAAG